MDHVGRSLSPERDGASARDEVAYAPPHAAVAAAIVDADGVAGPDAPDDPVHILLVDDRPENLVALAATLEAPGYNLVTARSGAEALRQLLRDEFALVLLDVLMPDMDGFEVAALIRQRDPSRRVPIIFMTAMGGDVGSIYRGYTSGAVDYLVKPIDPEVVRAKVAVFVELFRKNQQIQRQAELLRQSAEREQRRSRATLDQFRSTLDAVRDGVWIFEPDPLRFTYVNEGASRLAGYDRAALLAMGPLDLVPDTAGLRATLAQLRDGSRDVLTLDAVQRRRDGTTHPVELSLQYITPPGESGRFVAIVRDVTERRHADAERARLYGEARTAIRARDEFLSIASHELKTPLTSLKLYVKTLLRAAGRGDPSAAQCAHKLEAIDRQVDRLTKLINNLLDVSRITAGRIDLELDDVDLTALVRDIAERARDELARAGCPFTLRANEGVVGRWDPLRLDQVITNLLSNAIKYGNGKPIEMALAADGPAVRVTVRDHGIGIAPDHQARIFQRFERAVSERQYGGFGLGLWICRQIVNALRGEIAVASTPGEGSTFTVTLPRTRAS
jgi:PAS domain S-box-containing protein